MNNNFVSVGASSTVESSRRILRTKKKQPIPKPAIPESSQYGDMKKYVIITHLMTLLITSKNTVLI